MKNLFLSCTVLFASGVAQAAVEAAPAEQGSSPYLIVLAAVALIGTITHRRNKRKARS
jgi:hypothetical protein